MELPQVGQRCTHPDCKQLDFLPLQCKCGKLFCCDHFNSHIQSCEAYANPESELKSITGAYKCSKSGCPETNLVPIICERCKGNFCVRHRHLTECSERDARDLAEERERYAAPVRQFNLAKKEVDKQIEASITKARKGKHSVLANKVQLMKIKSKARGLKGIPTADRVYFSICHEENEPVPVFVSRAWSVGRAIDSIAEECQLRNDNHKSGEKKLRLFKQSGEIVSKDVAENLGAVLGEERIVDGERLLIGYVKEECERVEI